MELYRRYTVKKTIANSNLFSQMDDSGDGLLEEGFEKALES